MVTQGSQSGYILASDLWPHTPASNKNTDKSAGHHHQQRSKRGRGRQTLLPFWSPLLLCSASNPIHGSSDDWDFRFTFPPPAPSYLLGLGHGSSPRHVAAAAAVATTSLLYVSTMPMPTTQPCPFYSPRCHGSFFGSLRCRRLRCLHGIGS
jgi:hypothetical protein